MRLFFKKIFSKSTLKMLFCLSCILFLCLTPNFVFNLETYTRNINKFLYKPSGEKIVLNVWHIESFEGGKKNRKKYLEEIGIKFNKINPNLFVSILSITEEQLALNLQSGLSADVYSFSIGSGDLLKNNLKNLPQNKVIREDLQEFGKIGEEILAYPYMLSCYVAISRNDIDNQTLVQKLNVKNKKEKYSFGFSLNNNLNIPKALIEKGVLNLNKDVFLDSNSTYEAYVNFVNGNFNSLIGTMRDYYRCKNREDLGKLFSCSYEFLSEYTDLIQFASVDKNLSEEKSDVAQSFLNFLLSDYSQNKIKDCGLFTTTNLKIYENTEFFSIEQKLTKSVKSINVFSSLSEIEKNKKESFSKLFGLK